MSKTLTAGEHKLVFTRGVNDRIADDNKFSAFVWKSLLQFNRGDWGGIDNPVGIAANDYDTAELNDGRYGQPLGIYTPQEEGPAIWIIRNIAEVDGTQAITVLFPDEY